MSRETTARLLRKVSETEQAKTGLCGRGIALMSTVAGAYRAAADTYATDPTLVDCPAGRQRPLDLVEEICRQVRSLVRSATSGRGGTKRWPIEDRWEEAEALAARLPGLLAEARQHARADHDTTEGSQAISRMWLTASSHSVRLAGETLREALSKARSMPHPDPEIADLEALATEIIKRAEALEGSPLQPAEQWLEGARG